MRTLFFSLSLRSHLPRHPPQSLVDGTYAFDAEIGSAPAGTAVPIKELLWTCSGMLASSKMLNEEVYLAQKFQRAVIGNNHVDNCARL